MERPREVEIDIRWIDDNGEFQHAVFNQDNLEGAENLIALMDGNISEEDLKPE